MWVLIDIDKKKYDVIKSKLYNTFPYDMKEWGLRAIRNGIPFLEYHERLKDIDKDKNN